MIFESDQYYDGFPHAISSENEEKPHSMITLWLTHWRSACITTFLVKSSMAVSRRSGPSLPTVRLNSWLVIRLEGLLL
jgi:hypothetical protein